MAPPTVAAPAVPPSPHEPRPQQVRQAAITACLDATRPATTARHLRQDAMVAAGIVGPGSAIDHQCGTDANVAAWMATLDLTEPLIRDVLGRTGQLPR